MRARGTLVAESKWRPAPRACSQIMLVRVSSRLRRRQAVAEGALRTHTRRLHLGAASGGCVHLADCFVTSYPHRQRARRRTRHHRSRARRCAQRAGAATMPRGTNMTPARGAPDLRQVKGVVQLESPDMRLIRYEVETEGSEFSAQVLFPRVLADKVGGSVQEAELAVLVLYTAGAPRVPRRRSGTTWGEVFGCSNTTLGILDTRSVTGEARKRRACKKRRRGTKMRSVQEAMRPGMRTDILQAPRKFHPLHGDCPVALEAPGGDAHALP